jgi:hypothetical protein
MATSKSESTLKSSMIERLFLSFEELETAIRHAQRSLELRPNTPSEIICRLRSYDTILTKQRVLAHKLCDYLARQEWDEVSRHVNLINGLSNFIKDDARSILGENSSSSTGLDESIEDYTSKPTIVC